jgi:hypothetical protein
LVADCTEAPTLGFGQYITARLLLLLLVLLLLLLLLARP